MSERVLYKYPVTLQTSKCSSCSHFLQFFHVRCLAMTSCIEYSNCGQRCICILYCILDSVYYFSNYCRPFPASKHCLAGFTLLCIITHKSISPQSLSTL